ncbi:hypothetical protein GGF32_002795 [Allomyces javanicus]|nr:hypothetical protein GGF32_002795 [Allomyces javanicus]
MAAAPPPPSSSTAAATHLCYECDPPKLFGRKHDLARHHETQHRNQRPFRCPRPGCALGTNRRDQVKRHLRSHPACALAVAQLHDHPETAAMMAHVYQSPEWWPIFHRDVHEALVVAAPIAGVVHGVPLGAQFPAGGTTMDASAWGGLYYDATTSLDPALAAAGQSLGPLAWSYMAPAFATPAAPSSSAAQFAASSATEHQFSLRASAHHSRDSPARLSETPVDPSWDRSGGGDTSSAATTLDSERDDAASTEYDVPMPLEPIGPTAPTGMFVSATAEWPGTDPATPPRVRPAFLDHDPAPLLARTPDGRRASRDRDSDLAQLRVARGSPINARRRSLRASPFASPAAALLYRHAAAAEGSPTPRARAMAQAVVPSPVLLISPHVRAAMIAHGEGSPVPIEFSTQVNPAGGSCGEGLDSMQLMDATEGFGLGIVGATESFASPARARRRSEPGHNLNPLVALAAAGDLPPSRPASRATHIGMVDQVQVNMDRLTLLNQSPNPSARGTPWCGAGPVEFSTPGTATQTPVRPSRRARTLSSPTLSNTSSTWGPQLADRPLPPPPPTPGPDVRLIVTPTNGSRPLSLDSACAQFPRGGYGQTTPPTTSGLALPSGSPYPARSIPPSTSSALVPAPIDPLAQYAAHHAAIAARTSAPAVPPAQSPVFGAAIPPDAARHAAPRLTLTSDKPTAPTSSSGNSDPFLRPAPAESVDSCAIAPSAGGSAMSVDANGASPVAASTASSLLQGMVRSPSLVRISERTTDNAGSLMSIDSLTRELSDSPAASPVVKRGVAVRTAGGGVLADAMEA